MSTFTGKAARDIWHGTAGNDVARGWGGNDSLYGAGGDDKIYGDDGDDGLYGEAGHDQLFGGNGIDALFGGDGNDWLDGGAGNDYLSGGAGNNKVYGGAGNDTIAFSHRPDYAEPDGSGVIDGGAGFDTLVIDVQGAVTEDRCREVCLDLNTTTGKGALGIVTSHIQPTGLWFGSVQSIEEIRAAPTSNPIAIEVSQSMKVTGGNSADFLLGNDGDQVFVGGAGSDTFVFSHRVGSFTGNDEVLDFSLAQGDRLMFAHDDDRIVFTATEEGSHTVYAFTDSETGHDLGTLEINAIGLPAPEYYIA